MMLSSRCDYLFTPFTTSSISVRDVPYCSSLDHLKHVDLEIIVGAPDCTAVFQYGNYERNILSCLFKFTADLQIFSQEAYRTVSILDSLVHMRFPRRVGL